MTHQTDQYEGSYGKAVRLKIDPSIKGAENTVTWWLLTGSWHPLWSQFVICVIHLRETEGHPDPHLQFPGASHELLVMALDPGEPSTVHVAEDLERGVVPGFLRPIDVVLQFEATDEEMDRIVELCAEACVTGFLNPSTDDARETLRENWLATIVRTLAHIRGEEYAH